MTCIGLYGKHSFEGTSHHSRHTLLSTALTSTVLSEGYLWQRPPPGQINVVVPDDVEMENVCVCDRLGLLASDYWHEQEWFTLDLPFGTIPLGTGQERTFLVRKYYTEIHACTSYGNNGCSTHQMNPSKN